MRVRSIVLAAVIVIGAAHPACALKISPFKILYVPGERAAESAVLRVENNTAESAAVQVSAQTWDIAHDGTEINQDAENEFVIFPPQLVLKPHESRAVRIQWLGAGPPSIEKSYRIVAEQVPVSLGDTEANGAAVRFMLRFKAAFYVSPQGAKSDVSVSGIKVTPDRLMELTLTNKGNAHTLLREPALHLTLENGMTMAVSGDQVKPLQDENIHAGESRVFTIKLPPDVVADIKTVNIDFKPAF